MTCPDKFMMRLWLNYQWTDLWRMLGIVLVSFLISQITLGFFLSINMHIAAIRPNTGLAVAVLFFCGIRYWPAIFLGSFFSRLVLGYSLPGAVAVALSLVAGASCAVWLLSKNKPFDPSFRSFNDYLRFLFLAGIAGIAVNAPLGSFAVVEKMGDDIHLWLNMMVKWWRGDMLGIVVVAPLIMVWSQLPRHWLHRRLVHWKRYCASWWLFWLVRRCFSIGLMIH